MSPTGLISGTPTAQNSSPATITVTVTDAFLRTDTDSFTWRIYPALAATTPGARANTTADSVNFDLSPYVSGGTGSPYTWSLASGSLPNRAHDQRVGADDHRHPDTGRHLHLRAHRHRQLGHADRDDQLHHLDDHAIPRWRSRPTRRRTR